MKHHTLTARTLLGPAAAVLSMLAGAELHAQNIATNPAAGDTKWLKRHEGFVEQTKQGGIDLLFLGASITDGWRTAGNEVWDKFYAPRHAAAFGNAGDRTQHLLWRIRHGEVDGLQPKVVVVLIGTANTFYPSNTSVQVTEGICAVVKELRARLAQTKILLLAIFPRGEKTDPVRAELKEINIALGQLELDPKVRFLDLGAKFLTGDGTLSREVMPDLIHPNAKGYQIWAEAMEATLADMVR